MVKFVSYDGKYPNLCSGVCVLEIDGKRFEFGYGKQHHPFWASGGTVTFSRYWEATVTTDEWVIAFVEDEFKPYINEMIEVFNDNVPFGCCGGCI